MFIVMKMNASITRYHCVLKSVYNDGNKYINDMLSNSQQDLVLHGEIMMTKKYKWHLCIFIMF